MRTTMNRVLNSVRNPFCHTERQYDVSGTITFTLSSTYGECDVTELRQAILAVDAQFPWKDVDTFQGVDVKSIGYLNKGQLKTDNWEIPERICWFQIVPGIERLAKGQLHAYEKYLSKIAEELAKMKLTNVRKVRYGVKTITGSEFKVR